MEPAKRRDDSYVSEWMEGKCRVFPAPLGVQIKNDQHNFVEPDITLICDNDKLDEGNCHGVPDFIVEIVSPSNWNNASENDVKENNAADNDMPENVSIDSDWEKISSNLQNVLKDIPNTYFDVYILKSTNKEQNIEFKHDRRNLRKQLSRVTGKLGRKN